MISVDKLPYSDVCDRQNVGQNWVRHHERTASQKVYIRSLSNQGSIKHVERSMLDHTYINHVAEGVTTHEKDD